MGHAHFCQRLFQLDVNSDSRAERSGTAAKAGKTAKGPLFGLPTGVVLLSNNSRQTDIITMMPDFNAHGLDPSWAEPEAERVQEFFDNLLEKYVREEPLLIEDTTKEELDYIAARAAEAALSREAGNAGHEEDKADSAAEEKEVAQWVKAAGEASGANTKAPLNEHVDKELTEEEVEAADPPAVGKRRVLCRAGSGEPVRPGRTVQRQQVQEQSARQTRATAVRKAVKVPVAKKKAAASSSSKRRRTPSPSPPLADVDTEVMDTETLAQRVAKRAKASTGDKAPVGISSTPLVVGSSPESSPRRSPRFSPQQRQQEEPPRATPKLPPPSTTPPRGASPARASTYEPMPMEEEEEMNLGAGGSTPTTNVGGEGATSSQPGAGASSADQENIDTVIKEVARDAEAEANKIVAEEAAKTKAEADLEGRVTKTQAWFCQAHEELKVAQDLLAERKLELVIKQSDIEKAQERAREQAAKDEVIEIQTTIEQLQEEAEEKRGQGTTDAFQ
nr:nucleolar and coiled-body phosphoprotein 1-like [Aegilops tauschii subsp. strangulata]